MGALCIQISLAHLRIQSCNIDWQQRVAPPHWSYAFTVAVPGFEAVFPAISRDESVTLQENVLFEDMADDVAGSSSDPLRAYPLMIGASLCDRLSTELLTTPLSLVWVHRSRVQSMADTASARYSRA